LLLFREALAEPERCPGPARDLAGRPEVEVLLTDGELENPNAVANLGGLAPGARTTRDQVDSNGGIGGELLQETLTGDPYAAPERRVLVAQHEYAAHGLGGFRSPWDFLLWVLANRPELRESNPSYRKSSRKPPVWGHGDMLIS
jgi:hypothetical protein